jgi:hypothetical protein
MLSEGCQFKVVGTNGGDEVPARASNLLIGRAALERAERMYPRTPNPPPSLRATADAATESRGTFSRKTCPVRSSILTIKSLTACSRPYSPNRSYATGSPPCQFGPRGSRVKRLAFI